MDHEMALELGNAMGQRELFYYLQKACLANGGSLTIDQLNQYSDVIMVKENIFEVEQHESELQQALREASITIAKKKEGISHA